MEEDRPEPGFTLGEWERDVSELLAQLEKQGNNDLHANILAILKLARQHEHGLLACEISGALRVKPHRVGQALQQLTKDGRVVVAQEPRKMWNGRWRREPVARIAE